MNKSGIYSLFVAASILWVLGFVFVNTAQSRSAASDPNHPASESPSPEDADPNTPDSNQGQEQGEEDQTDLLLNAEENESRIAEFFDSCDRLFMTYVSEDGLVHYADLRRNRLELLPILRLMKEISPLQIMALNQKQKTAFWINVYNICVLQLIVENYPIQPKWYMILYPNNSIMQISNPWTKHYFWVQGLQYNLKEIEEEFLLNRTRDPRICFALSNASLGGGRLRPEAYRAETLDEQLDDQVRRYLRSPFGFRLDRENRVIHLSVLFETKRKTFLESSYAEIKRFREYSDLERTWLNFLVRYLPPEDVEFIENHSCIFKMISYDWHLDDHTR